MGHLKDVNMSYLGHLKFAWVAAFWFALGAVRLIIHGILPNVDTKAGQNTANRITRKIDETR